MFSRNDSQTFFPFIDRAHPFHAQMERFRAIVAASAEFRELQVLADPDRCEVHADLKAVSQNGEWQLERFYWCLQVPQRSATMPFRTRMLYYRADREGPVQYAYPADPYLRELPGYVEEVFGRGDSYLRVLRYVPLRRLTFLVEGAGTGPRVGKLKRGSKIRESCDKLAIAFDAAHRARASFRVARPLEFDARHCVFYQEALPGRSLLSMMESANWLDLLERVGEIHAELSSLDASGLPPWRAADYLDIIDTDVAWIAFFCPEHGSRLAAAAQRARRVVSCGKPTEQAFCHADFVPSQLLVDGDHWAITDFDSARRGDPHQEVAKFCAGLKYEVPFFRQSDDADPAVEFHSMAQGEAAYLRGFRRRAMRPLDSGLLAAFRVCAEIHHLALMLKKDGYYAPTFSAVAEMVEELGQSLPGSADASARG